MAHSENIRHGDPVHSFFGGGRAADLFLWRKKKVSAAVLGAATLTWYYVEFLGLPFITFACTFSILTFSILVAVATGAISLLIPIPKEPIPIPEVYLPKELFLEAALAIHTEIYRALVLAREVAVKGAYRRYLMICSVLFFVIVLLLVVPVLFKNALLLYERYGCNICTYAQKSMAETKEDRATFVAQVIKDQINALKRDPVSPAVSTEQAENVQDVTDSDSSSEAHEEAHICAMANNEDNDDEVSSTSTPVSTSPTFEDMLNEFEIIKKGHEILKQENLQLQLSNLELKEENDLLKNNYENMSIDCDTSKIENEKLMVSNHQLAYDLSETKSHLESKTNDYALLESRNKNLLKKHDELDIILKGFEKSSRRMEELLSSGKLGNDRHDLGYNPSSSSSHPIPNQQSLRTLCIEGIGINIPRTSDHIGTSSTQRTTRVAILPPRSYHIQRNSQPQRPARQPARQAVRQPTRQNPQPTRRTYSQHLKPVRKATASNYPRHAQYQQWYSVPRYRIHEPHYLSRRQKAVELHYHQSRESNWKPRRQAYRSKKFASFHSHTPGVRPTPHHNPSHFMHNHHQGYNNYVPARRRYCKKGPDSVYSKPMAVRQIWVSKGTYTQGPNFQRVPQDF
ncbi:hypothetical protein OROHE_015143 [Orobanche hederae]